MDDVIKNKKRGRKIANENLLEMLAKLVAENPDLRFGQILFNYGFLPWHTTQDGVVIDDPFYEEPVDTLNRVKTIIDESCRA